MSHDIVDGADTFEAASVALSAACQAEVDKSIDMLPAHLDCTGLYTNIAQKRLSGQLHAYKPAHALWSDGAEKQRWLFVPGNKTIDADTPDSWVFPVGTKAWKEFSVGGQRIETRLYAKTSASHWSRATYRWNEGETNALRNGGEDITVDGQVYHLPSGTECDDCHGGRKDRLLGFEQVSLGLDGATGLTLSELVAQNKLTNMQGDTHYAIGDDGSGVAAEALGWLHINCGVSCHNANPNSKGYSRGMRLELDPAQLDGQDPSQFLAITTTIGADATTMRWLGHKRIVAGSPEDSLLYTLITQRGDKQQQMPPVASRLVDADNSAIVAEWIEQLKDPSATSTNPL